MSKSGSGARMSRQKLTHGEAYVQLIDSPDFFKLEATSIEHKLRSLPPKMSKTEAGAYYNQKLFTYWLEQLDETIPLKVREEALRFMMFKNPKGENNACKYAPLR